MNTIKFIGKGSYHEENGSACQDRLLCTDTGEKTIIAVSDGCSSSPFGGEAAEANINTISRIFSSFDISSLTKEGLKELFPQAAQHFDKIYDNNPVSLLEICIKLALMKTNREIKGDCSFFASDYCATLLFAVREENETLIGHIGDGFIMCFDKKGKNTFVSEAENGETSSHTFFTTSSNYEKYFHLHKIPSSMAETIVMFSDGPQRFFTDLGKGDIVKGVQNHIIEKLNKNNLKSDKELEEAIRADIICDYDYIADDWSLVIATNKTEQKNIYTPVSLTEMFMEEYYSRVRFDKDGNRIQNEAPTENKESISAYKQTSSDKKPVSEAITNEEKALSSDIKINRKPINLNLHHTDRFKTLRLFLKDFSNGIKDYM